jgi:hypothetical protein
MGLRTQAALIVALAACNPLVIEPAVPNLPPAPDARSCQEACARLVSLRCPEGDPTPDGTTCVEVCENVEESGVVRYPTGCVAAAKTCAEAVACE